MSAQMLLVQIGIRIILLGLSLHKNPPVAKGGVQYMLSVSRQGLRCLLAPCCVLRTLVAEVCASYSWTASYMGSNLLKRNEAFWHDRTAPGENKAFHSAAAYSDLKFSVWFSEFLLKILFCLCTQIHSSDFHKIQGRENPRFLRRGSVPKSLWLHVSACKTSDPRGAGGVAEFLTWWWKGCSQG